MFWKLFYKLKGVEGLNEAIDNGNIKDSANFLKVYLDRPFDNSCDEPFKIFDFIDDFVVEDKDYELCEQMMIGSKYFETMTSEKVILALDEFSSITTWGFNTEKFSRYLISKIPDSDILLNESLETVACLYECYSGLGIEDFIIDLGKIYVIKLSSLLGCSNSKELLKYCRGTLFEEEIKEACIKGNLSVEDIFDLMLDKYDTSELDVLFEIIMSKNKRENPVDDITRLSELSVFKQFLDELNKGTCMGMDAIHFILDKVTDDALKKELENQYDKYREISSRIHELYPEYSDKEPHKTSAMNKVMTFYGIEMKTMNDDSTSKIAELLLKGTNMGIIEGRRLLNHKDTEENVNKLVEEYVSMQEEAVEKLKTFL